MARRSENFNGNRHYLPMLAQSWQFFFFVIVVIKSFKSRNSRVGRLSNTDKHNRIGET